MPILNGAKYACKSCVRGHRVSACTHNDRELTLIPPKGRPVKQCDHCRTARKSKSHHGKCDCGSKKDKSDQDVVPGTKADCCCHDGERCRCSIKHEAIEARMERSLKRPTLPVKSKPALVKSLSDEKVLQTMSGHLKATHRVNNAAHTSGQPYPLTRPHSHHGLDRADQQTLAEDDADASPLDQFHHSSMTIPEADDADIQDAANGYDFDKHFASASQQSLSAALAMAEAQSAQGEGQDFKWEWPQQTTSATTAGNMLDLTLDTTPSFTQDAMFPFSPADLPLISPQVSNFNQTISHSSDFTNETAWTAENYMVDGKIAVQDSWPALDATLVDESFQQTAFGKIPAFAGTAPQSFMSMTSVAPDLAGSPDKTARNNSMVIPADPDTPSEKAVEDWWPSGNFTSTSTSLDPTVQIPMEQPSQSRSISMDATNYDEGNNYDWLY